MIFVRLKSYDITDLSHDKNMATSITMFSAFLILLSVACVNGFSSDPVNPPAFVVNLDLPEEQRWTEVALKYKQLVPDIYAIMKYVILTSYI